MAQRSDYQTTVAAGMKALGAVYTYVAKSGLPSALMNLVYLRASQINRCAYCIDMHSYEAMTTDAAPVEKLLLVSAWRESGDMFTDRERAALAWTESVTLIAETQASDEEYAAARLQFSDKELADLTIGIGLINTYNRIAIAFRRALAPRTRAAATPGESVLAP